ncbi:Mitochondria-eating protein [Paragonimus heterotremus]|uniref:Mitochondria-eating protein n=1 Tax=Paragonimus heterotremus TaxID=100268 RepID=A0A8J4T506_9TREM|nr:Mitochondria-eating protein [Paragonimus heterotremus]
MFKHDFGILYAGGIYGGASAIKSRLLPLLGSGFFVSGLTPSTSLSVLASTSAKASELEDIKKAYSKSLEKLESDFRASCRENSRLKSELENAKYGATQKQVDALRDELDDQNLKRYQSRLHSLEEENQRLQTKLMQKTHLETDGRRDTTASDKNGAISDEKIEPYQVEPVASPVSGISPLSSYDPLQRSRHQLAVMRYNELFSGGRIEAMGILRRHLDDHDMNQCIIFHAVMEAFNVAKAHFRIYRNRVRTKLASATSPPSIENLDELVQSHINVHATYAVDVASMTEEVKIAMERLVPRLRIPSTALGFNVINEFIQDACKLAWECCTLAQPLDVYRPVYANEVIDDTKYRRSHDSSYSAVLVHHHIWPCLVQNGSVIAKGEVCTKRGRPVYGVYGTLPESDNVSGRSRTHGNTRSCSPVLRTASPGTRNLRSLQRLERQLGRTPVRQHLR